MRVIKVIGKSLIILSVVAVVFSGCRELRPFHPGHGHGVLNKY